MRVEGILNYSLSIKKGDRVFIFADEQAKKYCDLLSEKIIERGSIPFVLWNDFFFNKLLIACQDEEIYKGLFEIYEKMIDSCNVAIMLDNNIESYEGINYEDVINFKNKYYLKIFKKIMNFQRWVYLRYPQQELADLFGLSYEEQEKLLEEVSNFDYQKLADASLGLKKLLDKTTKIRVVQGLTDVTFTKEGINSTICCGKINLPDGEVYTAPEKYSMNGRIHFNVASYFRGKVYTNVIVDVVNGKIVKSQCNLDDEFERLLDSDSGSRYFGEFAFGLNPYIDRNYSDNLFNEKMCRTIHFAIGYPHHDTNNSNESLVHWDLIVDMKDGGEVYFDDVLIQKDGIFTLEELKGLNAKEKNRKKIPDKVNTLRSKSG